MVIFIVIPWWIVDDSLGRYTVPFWYQPMISQRYAHTKVSFIKARVSEKQFPSYKSLPCCLYFSGSFADHFIYLSPNAATALCLLHNGHLPSSQRCYQQRLRSRDWCSEPRGYALYSPSLILKDPSRGFVLQEVCDFLLDDDNNARGVSSKQCLIDFNQESGILTAWYLGQGLMAWRMCSSSSWSTYLWAI